MPPPPVNPLVGEADNDADGVGLTGEVTEGVGVGVIGADADGDTLLVGVRVGVLDDDGVWDALVVDVGVGVGVCDWDTVEDGDGRGVIDCEIDADGVGVPVGEAAAGDEVGDSVGVVVPDGAIDLVVEGVVVCVGVFVGVAEFVDENEGLAETDGADVEDKEGVGVMDGVAEFDCEIDGDADMDGVLVEDEVGVTVTVVVGDGDALAVVVGVGVTGALGVTDGLADGMKSSNTTPPSSESSQGTKSSFNTPVSLSDGAPPPSVLFNAGAEVFPSNPPGGELVSLNKSKSSEALQPLVLLLASTKSSDTKSSWSVLFDTAGGGGGAVPLVLLNTSSSTGGSSSIPTNALSSSVAISSVQFPPRSGGGDG